MGSPSLTNQNCVLQSSGMYAKMIYNIDVASIQIPDTYIRFAFVSGACEDLQLDKVDFLAGEFDLILAQLVLKYSNLVHPTYNGQCVGYAEDGQLTSWLLSGCTEFNALNAAITLFNEVCDSFVASGFMTDQCADWGDNLFGMAACPNYVFNFYNPLPPTDPPVDPPIVDNSPIIVPATEPISTPVNTPVNVDVPVASPNPPTSAATRIAGAYIAVMGLIAVVLA
jgi:hypothetical protein